MAGTHKTKNISEVSGTTKKPFRQKGTGNARQGSLRSVHMKGGAVAHGPRVRSHAIKLNKKVRKSALCQALSIKQAEGKLFIIDNLDIKDAKTSYVAKVFGAFNGKSYFIVDGEKLNENFAKASRNIFNVNAVPQIGVNVYDIIKHDFVMLTADAVKAIEARLSNV